MEILVCAKKGERLLQKVNRNAEREVKLKESRVFLFLPWYST